MLIAVHLVGNHKHRQLAATQDVCHFHVEVGHTHTHIHHEQNHVALLNGDEHLTTDFLLEYIIGIDHPTASVHNRELLVSPFTLAILAVACRTCLVTHNGVTGLCQSVEKGRFAHIRATHDSH